MFQNPFELQRVQVLLQHASQHVSDTESEISRVQVDVAKERTQFFEKLMIGSGATIAAIVSFLSTRSTKLQPIWVMRSSLVLLVIAIVAALYRNYRYPYYFLAAKKWLWEKAKLYEQECKINCLKVDSSAVDLRSGERIDSESWIAGAEKSSVEVAVEIEKQNKLQERLFREIRISEYVCLAAIVLAVLSLVVLAFRNF